MIIVGQGLAGTLLGLALEARGVEFEIWDSGERNASQAAAGLIVPVGGMRWQKLPHLEVLLPFARRRYRELEAHFGVSLLHPTERLRLFRSAKDRDRFFKRYEDSAYRPYFGEIVPPVRAGFGLRDEWGGVWLKESFWLDVRRLLDQARRRWQKEGRFRRESARFSAKTPVVFCEGWQVIRNPYFKALPWQPVFGEILTLRAEGFPPFTVQREKWLLPIGEDRYRLGSTYRNHFEQGGTPTKEGRRELLSGLRALFRGEIDFAIEAEAAGVRIKANDHRPVLGRHPEHPEIYLFNGFGSHGALQIPYHAEQLTRHLLEGEPLPPEVDLRRFFR